MNLNERIEWLERELERTKELAKAEKAIETVGEDRIKKYYFGIK